MTTVELRIHYSDTRPGERLALVGDHAVLAQWQPTHPSSWMDCVGHGVWVKSVVLPSGTVQEFKFAVATEGAVVRWQDGPNRQLTVPDEPSEVHAVWASSALLVRPMPQKQGMRFMTFNCRFDTSRDGRHRWANRKEGFIRAIAEQRPDFFGVQEPLHHQVQDIRAGLPWYTGLGQGRDDGREAGEYSPIFFLTTKYRCVESGQFWLSETPREPGSRSWNSACCRVCTWGRFEAVGQEQASAPCLYFFNTHLDHESVLAQIEGVKTIMAHMLDTLVKNDELATARVVVMGDMNVDTGHKALQAFSDSQTWGLVLDNALDVSPVAKRSSGTFTGWSKRSVGITIDHIFVRRHGGDPGARHSIMDVVRYEVGTNIDPKIEGELITDHRPVTVDVCPRP